MSFTLVKDHYVQAKKLIAANDNTNNAMLRNLINTLKRKLEKGNEFTPILWKRLP